MKKTRNYTRLAVKLSCENYAIDSIANSFYHFMFSMLASLEIGHDRACEITTLHEVFYKKRVDSEVEIEKPRTDVNGIVRNPLRPRKKKITSLLDKLPTSKEGRMDLINNKAGLEFAQKKRRLARRCLQSLAREERAWWSANFHVDRALDREKAKFNLFPQSHPESPTLDLPITPREKRRQKVVAFYYRLTTSDRKHSNPCLDAFNKAKEIGLNLNVINNNPKYDCKGPDEDRLKRYAPNLSHNKQFFNAVGGVIKKIPGYLFRRKEAN